MKQCILLIICIVCSISVKAQEYCPFPTENAFWRHVMYMPYEPYEEKDFHYALDGDTIINDLIYKKIWHSDGYYYAAFREDVTNKKVYTIFNNQFEEKLLYDFDLKVGDDVSHFVDPTHIGKSIVDNIDFVLLGDELYHKRFRINFADKGRYSGFHMIEGIGSIENGLFWEFLSNPELNINGELKCVNVNGNTVFPRGGTCNPIFDAYCPFPSENAIWRGSNIHYNNDYSFEGTTEYHYAIVGDTVINNLTYHKLKRNSLYKPNAGPQHFSIDNEGAFREDVINKKVYFYSFYSNSEQLLYDFDLNVGDDVSQFIVNGESNNFNPPIVTEIDLIMLKDGLYHKRFHITGCYKILG